MAVLCWGGPRRQAEWLASKIPLAGPREGPVPAGWLQLGILWRKRRGGGRLGAERGRCALKRRRLALRRRALEDAQVPAGR